MISPIQRNLTPHNARNSVVPATSRNGNLFGNQLSSALRKPNGKITRPGDLIAPLQPRDTKSVSDTVPDTAPAAKSPAPARQDSVTAPNSPVDVLSAALQAAGIDPKALGMTAHDEICTYPGGSYVNHLITVTAPNGRTQDYMSNLMMLSPNVTVTEIKHLLTS